MALALIHATRKLPHYFQAHIVYILTEHPLQTLLRRSDFIRRITKWRTRHKSFDVRYKPRNAIKGQVLAYFVVKFTPTIDNAWGICQILVQPWWVYVDRASNTRGTGIGIVLESLEGIKLEQSLRLGFQASNSEAKYEALLVGL